MNPSTARLLKRRARFLKLLEETGNVSEAAKQARLGRTYLYKHRRLDPRFAVKWDRAMEIGADALESEARRRAVDGIEEPVFYKGAQCGTARKYSDILLIFLLKGLKPDKYADRKQVSGHDGGALQVEQQQKAIVIDSLPHDMMLALIKRANEIEEELAGRELVEG
jgi:hypothetical protein